jgi:hypothetical protein
MKSSHSPKLRPTLFDAVVVLLVAALAVVTAAWFYGGLSRSGPAEYIITHRGEEIARGQLSQTREITVDGEYHLSIVCDGKSISVAHSDCPTQDCVRTGKATHPGQSIVCLPEQVIVKLVGVKANTDPDLVIG